MIFISSLMPSDAIDWFRAPCAMIALSAICRAHGAIFIFMLLYRLLRHSWYFLPLLYCHDAVAIRCLCRHTLIGAELFTPYALIDDWLCHLLMLMLRFRFIDYCHADDASIIYLLMIDVDALIYFRHCHWLIAGFHLLIICYADDYYADTLMLSWYFRFHAITLISFDIYFCAIDAASDELMISFLFFRFHFADWFSPFCHAMLFYCCIYIDYADALHAIFHFIDALFTPCLLSTLRAALRDILLPCCCAMRFIAWHMLCFLMFAAGAHADAMRSAIDDWCQLILIWLFFFDADADYISWCWWCFHCWCCCYYVCWYFMPFSRWLFWFRLLMPFSFCHFTLHAFASFLLPCWLFFAIFIADADADFRFSLRERYAIFSRACFRHYCTADIITPLFRCLLPLFSLRLFSADYCWLRYWYADFFHWFHIALLLWCRHAYAFMLWCCFDAFLILFSLDCCQLFAISLRLMFRWFSLLLFADYFWYYFFLRHCFSPCHALFCCCFHCFCHLIISAAAIFHGACCRWFHASLPWLMAALITPLFSPFLSLSPLSFLLSIHSDFLCFRFSIACWWLAFLSSPLFHYAYFHCVSSITLSWCRWFSDAIYFRRWLLYALLLISPLMLWFSFFDCTLSICFIYLILPPHYVLIAADFLPLFDDYFAIDAVIFFSYVDCRYFFAFDARRHAMIRAVFRHGDITRMRWRAYYASHFHALITLSSLFRYCSLCCWCFSPRFSAAAIDFLLFAIAAFILMLICYWYWLSYWCHIYRFFLLIASCRFSYFDFLSFSFDAALRWLMLLRHAYAIFADFWFSRRLRHYFAYINAIADADIDAWCRHTLSSHFHAMLSIFR